MNEEIAPQVILEHIHLSILRAKDGRRTPVAIALDYASAQVLEYFLYTGGTYEPEAKFEIEGLPVFLSDRSGVDVLFAPNSRKPA